MALDKLAIGERIRQIREETFHETRAEFADRCHLETRHLGDIERGNSLMKLPTLDCIYTGTHVSVDTILYGIQSENKLKKREILIDIIKHANEDELDMYCKCISAMSKYLNNKNKAKT